MRSVVCPGGEYECPDGTTCCRSSTGGWNCCPYPNGVCCSDGEHCCPEGTTCDVSQRKCIGQETTKTLIKKVPAKIRKMRNVVCPGGEYECPDGTTCCKSPAGVWGCCPLPNAVCCSDGEHCCPEGTTCDVSQRKCIGQETTKTLIKKVPAKVKASSSVICPDGKTKCEEGQTCCKLISGQWGCCPFPNAVCCSDGVHCCPAGFTCDPSTGLCSRGSKMLKMLLKNPATKAKSVGDVVCPDGRSACPNGDTCCKRKSGEWACCPLPEAVCCSDGEHCCPKGYTCDKDECYKGSQRTKMYVKYHAIQVKTVVCPGGDVQCPDGNTCCQMGEGYGCCPLSHAVCCLDLKHCCPKGYTCDVKEGKCNKTGETVTMVAKIPAIKRIRHEVPDEVCVDDAMHVCPKGKTCCQMPRQSSYGCCPFEHATCCEGIAYCCPQGYRCDFERKECVKIPRYPWSVFKKSALTPVQPPDLTPKAR